MTPEEKSLALFATMVEGKLRKKSRISSGVSPIWWRLNLTTDFTRFGEWMKAANIG
jgi:hypothetical protein